MLGKFLFQFFRIVSVPFKLVSYTDLVKFKQTVAYINEKAIYFRFLFSWFQSRAIICLVSHLK